MDHDTVARKPFPIPVVAAAIGPGSQPDDEDGLDYLVMPSGMATYDPPLLPEPEAVIGHAAAVAVLEAALAALQACARGEVPAPIGLDALGADDRALVNQLLGEGEVSAQVLADDGTAGVRIQESVYAGVWRVIEQRADGSWHDRVEVGAIPALLREVAAADARRPSPPDASVPAEVYNVPPILVELADQAARWAPGGPAHVVNLTLLPLGPHDIACLDHVLGTGRVVILSRGYGNCRITNTLRPHTWRVVYYNSQDQVILNSVEVTGLPEVACAAVEDLQDSAERLAEVLDWVRAG